MRPETYCTAAVRSQRTEREKAAGRTPFAERLHKAYLVVHDEFRYVLLRPSFKLQPSFPVLVLLYHFSCEREKATSGSRLFPTVAHQAQSGKGEWRELKYMMS